MNYTTDEITFEEMDRYRKIKIYSLIIGIGLLFLFIIMLICPPVTAISINEIKQSCSLSNSYPIGSVYTTTSSLNPRQILGYGNWVRIGEGKVMLGVDSSNSEINQSLIEGSF